MLEQIRKFGIEAGLNMDNKEQGKCVKCNQPFSEQNTHTPAGWKETGISGMCEDCFDDLFEEEDE